MPPETGHPGPEWGAPWPDYLDTLAPATVASPAVALRETQPQRIVQAGGNVRLAIYLSLVDRVLVRLAGVNHRDLTDFLWLDNFDAGVSPRDAALNALEADHLAVPA